MNHNQSDQTNPYAPGTAAQGVFDHDSFIVPRRAFRNGPAAAEQLFERVLRKYGPAA